MADKKSGGPTNFPAKGIFTNTFDQRIQSIPSYLPNMEGTSSTGLHHGYLKTAFAKSSKKDGRFHILNFLYNPSTVSVNHSTDAANQVMPPYTRSDLDDGVPLVAAGGTLSFALLFDRTYEMSDPTKFDKLEGTYGVMADIHVLYNLVGINTSQEAQAADGDDKATSGNVLGIMQMSPVWARFGQARAAYKNNLPKLSRMEYFGYINNIGITYTHFSQRMTPVRCAVDISMTLMSSYGWV